MKKNLLAFILFSIVLFCGNQIPAQSTEANTATVACPGLSFCIDRFTPLPGYAGYSASTVSGNIVSYAWYIGTTTSPVFSTESAFFVSSTLVANRPVIVVVTDINGCSTTLTGPTTTGGTNCSQ